ncbi:hypothetical protein RO3G_07291 [Lichtheimia corymbifera JMRC:FSU:9682]|uniref:BZIP domain-containing protein n=1 Tax=Lichtheimia corymbifera JMRC:FSU:9682 TaxID=1263082 RepID=A0A068S4W8_9FUNG|nr:hypothetical protein RO3G_07291 [Lichtheimia corymbifera JMRC:FSU:9682]
MSSEEANTEDLVQDPSAPMIMIDTNEQGFDSVMISEQPCPTPVRKKPGRKPNPTSPAIRKAQNRAAQRAFRERKERYLRDLEASVKQMREDRDRLQAENEQFKSDLEILNAENWYLKGIVLTLQLVCFRHHLVLPQHSPYMSKEALTLLSKSIPEPVNAYIHANANNKPPLTVTKEGNAQGKMTTNHHRKRKQRQQYVTTTSICITKDGVQSVPHAGSDFSFPMDETEIDLSSTELSASPTLPSAAPHPSSSDLPDCVATNVAAIQTLRLRLRLQSACTQMESTPFTIQPTTLQLTIPHDPRIDLVPTPHMRDRMILFRGLFDLDECFRCILADSTFHGGDPADPSNWQLPCEFFQKFWFLTTDYTLHRITNKWRKIQGLQLLPSPSSPSARSRSQQEQSSYASSRFPDDTTTITSINQQQHAPPNDDNDLFSASPIQLTAGNNIPAHRSPAHLDNWETMLSTTLQNQYNDIMKNDHTFGAAATEPV